MLRPLPSAGIAYAAAAASLPPTTTNQPQSEDKHSLIFRVRRYTHLQCMRL